MSTILETKTDQKHEAMARAFLESHMGCKAISMPQFSPVDCLLIKDGVTAGVEFKFRNMDYDQYPNIWLEESKQLALIACLDVWDKAYFMPCLNGVLYRIEVTDTIGAPRTVGGRTDRNIDDIDLMVAVPMDKLTKVGVIWTK